MSPIKTIKNRTLVTPKGRAFTLVEILIVVVILGILAAMVVPQFASASESARNSSMLGSLQTVRTQIELYHAHHNSTYPTLLQISAAWNVLTNRTDVNGNVGNPPVDGVHIYGPYIKQMPSNPFENNSRTVAAAAAQGVGWVYNESTGRVYAVMPDAKAVEMGADKTNDVMTY